VDQKLFGRIRIQNYCSDPDLGPSNEHPLTKNFNFLLNYKKKFFRFKAKLSISLMTDPSPKLSEKIGSGRGIISGGGDWSSWLCVGDPAAWPVL
jgi:hypothetical protein